MFRARLFAASLCIALALCFFGLQSAQSQSGLRRITNTTEEGKSLNPSLSGDGRIVAFESTEDLAQTGGGDRFRALRADTSAEPPTFTEMGAARAVAPATSQDGSRIAFAARENPINTNADGNSEIFLFDNGTLRQITNTSPGQIENRVVNGNFQPSISDDGRFIAFSSNRDLTGLNADGNLEIFVYDAASAALTQLTNSLGTVGATDAKISGNGARVAFIRDGGASVSTRRDLMTVDRAGLASAQLIAGNVDGLALTYGRAISDDGARVVYSALTAPNSSQVFLFDGRGGNQIRPVTFLGSRATDVPLHPTISGDGSRIAFATRRSVLPNNTDSGVDLYTFDVPTGQTARVTNGPATATADVVSSLNDTGTLIAFNYPRVLSGAVVFPDYANNTEIYLTATATRPSFGTLTVLNGASFGNEPATVKAVAPNSIAVGIGGALANSFGQAERQPDGTFPRNVGGTTVTVNGRAAQIFFVSPSQVNFLVPAETEIGNAEVVITNADGFETRGSVAVLRAAPGIFTFTGDGRGEGVILDADTLQPGPFDPSNGQRRLIVFATGVRGATQVTVNIGGRFVTVEAIVASPNMPGMDEVHLLLPADLRGAGTVEMVIRADNRDSNPVTVTITGDTRRDIVINEVLADPPDGLAGDANRDGVRDTSQDEFVEIVNGTSSDIDISGYELLSRGTTDTLRHKFAANTILPAGGAIVVFGGGSFDSANPLFGGAQVFKSSTGSLSLVNGSGVVTLRDTTGAVASLFSYGGSTGLSADENQSLTRSPDVTGAFTGHLSASGSGGSAFSPGTRVDGSPFLSPAIARIEVTPATATIFVGQQQQYTARAFDANNQELSGVIFLWQTSNNSVATIDQTGVATGVSEGTAEIRASARGVLSAPATLTVNFVARVLTRIEVTPDPASIPVGGGQQFTARAFDQFNNEMTGVAFTWASADTNIATVDQTGLALGVSQGQTTITASAQNVQGAATLNVTPSTVVINEVLADPPDGTDGDANHDGVRDSSHDEFVELVNSTSAAINIAGWTIKTRPLTGSTNETTRHTFAAGTSLPAGSAVVVFGGGTFDANDPIFACALVVKASTAGLSLTNGGLNVIVRDAAGNLVTQFTFGGTTGLSGDANQSLTRSPDITGNYVQHLTATGAGTRRFSPGTRVNGTPFGPCNSLLTTVTISPLTASVVVGQTTQFTAQAFDQFGAPITNAAITFASDNTGVATITSVTTDPNTGIATATVTGQAAGTAHITAQSTSGSTTVTSSQATLTVSTTAATFTVTGQVRDSNNNPLSGVLITFELDFQGTLSVTTTQTDANGNYSSGDLGCQNNVKVTPSRQGFTFTPSALAFVNSSQCLTGTQTANFTGAPAAPGTLVISQVYGGGGNANATYTHDFVEIFNSGTTIVDFAVTPYSIQYTGATGSFGSTAAANKTNITSGTIAPGQYFLAQGATGGAVGAPLPTPDATGSLAMAATAGKVALVVGTTALPASTCPGDDGASPFNPANVTIADFVGYGSSANAVGHCYEGPSPAPAPSATSADFRKAGGCIDTNFNGDDFLVAGPNPRNTLSLFNNCSAGFTPEITINDPSAAESTANVTFTVTLSTASAQTVTVNYVTADNTATAGADYTAVSGTLSFAPGETSKTILVPVINDTLDEPSSETFFINLTSATNAVILDNQGQGTITDNDSGPSISINDVAVAEGDSGTTNITFNVTLSAASGQTVSVNYATADNTAAAGSDYQTTSGTLTFTPGHTVQTITVLVNGDTTFEQNETFFVDLTTPTNASISDNQGQGTITNDDAAPLVPAFSINDVLIAEGNSGTQTLNFTVTVSMNPTAAVTVDYATADGTATAPGDYQTTSGTLTFNPGDPLTKTISVTVNGDTFVEPDETFFVNLTNATAGSIITDSQGIGTITNDDMANLVISQIYGGGNNSGATYQRDFIEIFNRGTTTVDFSVTPYSVQYAGAGSNFTTNKTDLTSGTIAPGRYFLIQEAGGTTNGIALPTADASGSIALATSGGKVALVSGTGTLNGLSCPGDDLSTAPTNPSGNNIVDFVGYGGATCYEGPTGPAPAHSNTTADFREAGGCTDTNDNAADFLVFAPNPRNSASPVNDCSGASAPSLSINDVTVTEGNSGTVTATFTVSLSAPANGADVTFDITTADGTAQDDVPPTEDNDYVAKSLTSQIIPVGQQTYTFTVTVNGDTNVEFNETFFVNVANVTGATVADAQGQGTITNDDLPALSVNDVSQVEGDSGTSIISFTVSLSAPAPSTVTFDIATQDNTATVADNDYVARSLTGQTIAAGQQNFTFDVTINGDTTLEPSETFFVNVTNVTGATVADGQGQGTIQNDDSPPDLSINDVTLAEGNAGTTTFTFTVTLSAPAKAGGVTFDIATQDNTATVAGNDYTANTLTSQTIPQGSSTYTFDVAVTGDTIFEPDETFFVNVTNVTGANVVDAQGLGTITNDDAQPTITIADAAITEGNAGTSLMTFTVTLTGASQSNVTVNYATADSSATVANTDYDAASGMLTFVPGDATETFTVTIHGDAAAEGDEMFLVNLSGATGATLADNLALGTIFLDDPLPVASLNTAYAENFDTLAQTGVSSTTPAAWTRSETGTAANFTYTANNGGIATGDTYSYGTTGSSDRALGTLRTGTLVPTIGAFYRNDTGLTINSLQIAYTGEEWRLGTAARAIPDRLDFQYSTNATSLTTGTWTDVDALDFSTPNNTTTGSKDGNDPANRTAINSTITGLSIAPGATFWIRWNDFDATGADDGLAVDDFSLTAGVNTPALSINDVTLAEGNAGTTTFSFTVSLSSAAGPGGVTFDIATQDDTATTANNDYVAKSLTGQTIPAGQSSYTFDVTVTGDTAIEPTETFLVNVTNVTGATVSDGQGLGTIQNDDSPALSISDVTQAEGNTGTTTTFNFTVSLTQPAPAGGVSFTVNTADGTTNPATAGSDYVAIVNGAGSIAENTTSTTVSVTVNGDNVFEPNETFFVNITNVTGASVTDAQGLGTITNDDVIPQPTAGQVIINEVLVTSSTSATTRPDFIELYNTTAQSLDISGLVISFRGSGTTTTVSTVTLPGAVGSGTTVIAANSYFLVANGASVLNSAGTTAITADYNASASTFNLNDTTGAVKIELNAVKLDGFSYQTGAAAVPAAFSGFGEGTPFVLSSSATTKDFSRFPNATDTNNNATDFKLNTATANVTPKATNN